VLRTCLPVGTPFGKKFNSWLDADRVDLSLLMRNFPLSITRTNGGAIEMAETFPVHAEPSRSIPEIFRRITNDSYLTASKNG
jgi:hypothetical protein